MTGRHLRKHGDPRRHLGLLDIYSFGQLAIGLCDGRPAVLMVAAGRDGNVHVAEWFAMKVKR